MQHEATPVQLHEESRKSVYMEQEGGGDVLCLDVGQASLHECLLESAARKIIKGLALLFLEHLVLKQKVSSVSSI